MLPVALGFNQPASRFYRGGPRIAAFRGTAASGTHVPEDWVGSVTTVAGETTVGLTTLPDGRFLRDAVAGDPIAWLGRDHVDSYGPDPLLLVKLLDVGQRLPVHAHPDNAWALAHLGRPHGKAEAWYVLEPGEIFVGLRQGITSEQLLSLVSGQVVDALIGLLHHREVERGDTVYIPPGTLHAIGEGALVAEVQQPEDLSVLLEWHDFDFYGAVTGHLGVGFPTALTVIDRMPLSEAGLDALITSGRSGISILSSASNRHFQADFHDVSKPVEVVQGFAILIVTEGRLELQASGGELSAPRGSTILIPHAAGCVLLTGQGSALLFRPPAPKSRAGQ